MRVEKYCNSGAEINHSQTFGKIRKVKYLGLFCPKQNKLHADFEQTVLNSPIVRKLAEKHNFDIIIEDSMGLFSNRHYSSVMLQPVYELPRRFYNLQNKLLNKINPEKYPLERFEKSSKLPKRIYMETSGIEELNKEFEDLLEFNMNFSLTSIIKAAGRAIAKRLQG